jgi:tryptophanyl-tRNA synthetase
MLMAADILLYDTAVVPVGADQKQHVEYARDTAEKFNRIFKEEVFTLPEPYIMPEVAIVPGTDGKKMSKSYGNIIPLFASRDEIAKAVMSIVTDSSGERPENVYAIHKLVRSESELVPLYAQHAGKYKALKDALIEDLDRYIAPMRAKYEELQKSPDIVEQVLLEGKRAARAASEVKMEQVRKAIGVA